MGDQGPIGSSGSEWWPLQVGMEWHYKSRDSSGALLDGLDKWSVVECGSHAGKSGCRVLRESLLDGVYDDVLFNGWMSATSDGSRMLYLDGTGWVTVERGPIQDGARFSTGALDGGSEYGTWHQLGAVTVAGGSFSDCYALEWDQRDAGNGFWKQQTDTICKEIGWVQTTYQDNDPLSEMLPKELVLFSR